MIETILKHKNSAAERKILDTKNLRQTVGEWLVASEPTAAELDALAEKFALSRGDLQDVLDIDEAPRLDHDLHRGYLYVRRPYAHRDGSPTTRPLLLIFSTEGLLTIFPKLPDFFENLMSADSEFSTRSPQAATLFLLETIFSDYDAFVKTQNQKIKAIVAKMRTRKLENEDFMQFVILEDQINNFLSALSPIVPLLRRVAMARNLTLTDAGREELEDITLAVEQLIHLCNTNAARIVSIRETYATLSNNSLNRTMKTLTLATLLIAAPNLIFGMYGMNVHLPFATTNWGYFFTLSLAIILIIFMIIWARKRRLF